MELLITRYQQLNGRPPCQIYLQLDLFPSNSLQSQSKASCLCVLELQTYCQEKILRKYSKGGQICQGGGHSFVKTL